MPKKLKAVEVVSNQLWITYDQQGNKSGTLGRQQGGYSWLKADGSRNRFTENDITLAFNFEGKANPSSWHDIHVLGYPVIKIETFKVQERQNLPCFTKTPNSKVFFAAGYYGINFDNGGWLDSFCPKLATLCKYEYIGPFKTETDMTIAIQRKKRSDE